MIALAPIISFLIQFGPMALTLLSGILQYFGHPGVPVVADHPAVAGMASGFFVMGPHKPLMTPCAPKK